MSKPKPWHSMEVEEVLRELNVDKEGLTAEEASKRLGKYGYNELKEKKRRTALQMFLSEFKDVFILLLIAINCCYDTFSYNWILRFDEGRG
jgi:Ca2+-transporting ATPase